MNIEKFRVVYFYECLIMAESEQKDRDLKERIKWLIQYYRINDAAFAQKIQTNRSTLSQCLNGPNVVSKELILKIHDAYPLVTIEWLMFGEGSPFKSNQQAALDRIYSPENNVKQTDSGIPPEYSTDLPTELLQPPTLFSENKDNAIRNPMALSTVKSEAESRRIVKIMVFYSDNTFETYSLDKT